VASSRLVNSEALNQPGIIQTAQHHFVHPLSSARSEKTQLSDRRNSHTPPFHFPAVATLLPRVDHPRDVS
jgi:hypothetical protein